MSAKILDGRAVRDEIAKDLTKQITKLNPKPKLVIIQVGDNPESNTYIGQKIKFGQKIGALVDHLKLPDKVTQDSLEEILHNLNISPDVHGVIIQMPIPDSLEKDKLIDMIDPKKDVDGLTTTNQEALEKGKKDAVIPATAKGVIEILKFYKVQIKNKKAAVVGRSKLVGAPVASILKNMGATVEVGHSKTEDLTAVTKPADIIVVAVGKPNLIAKKHVTAGQTVIDVGINVEEVEGQRKLKGDVSFDEVSEIVGAISPVPGGVGPMTVASLFENLLEAYETQIT